LVHNDAEYTSAGFTRPTRRSFHYSEVTARADRESRLGQKRAKLLRFPVFLGIRPAF
jgi:hypothetical protein